MLHGAGHLNAVLLGTSLFSALHTLRILEPPHSPRTLVHAFALAKLYHTNRSMPSCHILKCSCDPPAQQASMTPSFWSGSLARAKKRSTYVRCKICVTKFKHIQHLLDTNTHMQGRVGTDPRPPVLATTWGIAVPHSIMLKHKPQVGCMTK